VWGLDNGYTLMFGGDAAGAMSAVRESLRPLRRGVAALRSLRRRTLRQNDSQRHQYAMMEAYAEGLALLKGNEKPGSMSARLRRCETRQRDPLVASRSHR
jgi:6-phosphogluconate dehydrogenase (decarboxylating)